MTAQAWTDLELLREPPPVSSAHKRSRAILRDIVTCSTVNNTPTLWRGQSSIDHRICPTIAHDLSNRSTRSSRVLDRTHKTLEVAERSSQRWRDGTTFGTFGPIARLAHLRHHGVPSPLLDVTPDPFIALWFATAPTEDNSDGILIGFNKTNHYTDVGTDPDYVRAYNLVIDGGGAEPADDRPFSVQLAALGTAIGVIDPPVLNDRIVVQRSRFLLSSFPTSERWHAEISDIWLPTRPQKWSKEKLDRLFDHDGERGRPSSVPLIGLHVPHALKPKLRTLLASHFGVDQSTVFPDVGGLPMRPSDYD